MAKPPIKEAEKVMRRNSINVNNLFLIMLIIHNKKMNKKTIWITGGSTGIGRTLAIKFASMGWNVAVSARRVELLNELSNSYENISAFPLDVTDKSKCKEVFKEVKTKFENIDICLSLIHISEPTRPY